MVTAPNALGVSEMFAPATRFSLFCSVFGTPLVCRTGPLTKPPKALSKMIKFSAITSSCPIKLIPRFVVRTC